MALEAQLGLRFPGAYVLGEWRAVSRLRTECLVTLCLCAVVHIMAIHAGHSPRLVRAASPEHLIPFGATGQASSVFLLDGFRGILGEADGDAILAAARVHVCSTRSVTGFAAVSLQRRF